MTAVGCRCAVSGGVSESQKLQVREGNALLERGTKTSKRSRPVHHDSVKQPQGNLQLIKQIVLVMLRG